MFKAILIDKNNEQSSSQLSDIDDAQLPSGDVDIDVQYSTINYKDALAITGASPVVRQFPMVPGIDLVGVVTQSGSPEFKAGDQVLLNGWGVGEKHWGGLAQKARLRSDWLIPLPKQFSAKQAMATGTAGYTAALCVEALIQHGLKPEQGPVLVTGASGGVGSVAISLLNKAGFEVYACTGKTSEADYLKTLGASDIIDRTELQEPSKPLQKERWAGVIDSVGSHTLVNACAQTRYGGAVAACGLAQGADFSSTVMPFILRGVSLLGIDSVMAPKEKRLEAWARLEQDLDASKLELISEEIALSQVISSAENVLQGKHRGRFVVDVNRF